MKINIWVLLGLVAIIGILAYFVISEHNDKVTAQKQLQAKKVLSDPTAIEVKHFTDSLQRQHATFNTGANKIDGKLVAVSKTLLDSVASASGIAPAAVVDWKSINSTTEARALKAERTVDSLKQVVFTYKDKYVSLAYHPGKNDTTAGNFDFAYNDNLSVTTYNKRGKFLLLPIGPKETYTDIYSNDPRTTINGLKTFSVQQNQPFFGLRVQAGATYSFRSKNFLVGPAAQLYLDRVSFVGTYYYSPVDNRFQPSVGLRYDLFR